jgi:mono/diheme cytochrome c family protein
LSNRAPRWWLKRTTAVFTVALLAVGIAVLVEADADGRVPESTDLLGVPNIAQAHQDWILNCQGCHRADASSQSGGAPTLAGNLAAFLALPEGRDYLVRVPGVAFAPLADDRLAALLNWTLQTYDRPRLPARFVPYTAGEVGALRKRPLILSSGTYRRELMRRLEQRPR